MDAVTLAMIKGLGGSGGGGSSGGGVLVVNVTETDTGNVCDKTAAEMYQAFQDGLVKFYDGNGYSLCVSAANVTGYGYYFTPGGSEAVYHADSGTDYPTDA